MYITYSIRSFSSFPGSLCVQSLTDFSRSSSPPGKYTFSVIFFVSFFFGFAFKVESQYLHIVSPFFILYGKTARLLFSLKSVAVVPGLAGFEPSYAGVKVLCSLPLGDSPLYKILKNPLPAPKEGLGVSRGIRTLGLQSHNLAR